MSPRTEKEGSIEGDTKSSSSSKTSLNESDPLLSKSREKASPTSITITITPENGTATTTTTNKINKTPSTDELKRKRPSDAEIDSVFESESQTASFLEDPRDMDDREILYVLSPCVRDLLSILAQSQQRHRDLFVSPSGAKKKEKEEKEGDDQDSDHDATEEEKRTRKWEKFVESLPSSRLHRLLTAVEHVELSFDLIDPPSLTQLSEITLFEKVWIHSSLSLDLSLSWTLS